MRAVGGVVAWDLERRHDTGSAGGRPPGAQILAMIALNVADGRIAAAASVGSGL